MRHKIFCCLKSLFLLLFVFWYEGLFGQNTFRLSIDSLIKPFELISARPIDKLMLEKEEIEDYEKFLEGSGINRIDTSILSEIIRNSNRSDTTLWSDNELRSAIIVQEIDKDIDLEGTLNKFSSLSKKKKNVVKKVILNHNNHRYSKSGIPGKSSVKFYSRPIYNNAGSFAAVAYSHPGSGGGVTIYYLKDRKWEILGDIKSWAY